MFYKRTLLPFYFGTDPLPSFNFRWQFRSFDKSAFLIQSLLLPSSTQYSQPTKPRQSPHLSDTHYKLRARFWPSMAASETSSETTLRHAFGNVLSFFILLLIGVLAFSIRLFSVSYLILNFYPPFTDLTVTVKFNIIYFLLP